MREEAICGAHGEIFSQANFSGAEGWYSITVPATTLGTLIRDGVYPDPYIGLNNLLIRDANPEHSKRYSLAEHSHLPDKTNPLEKPFWFRSSFSLPKSFTGAAIWLHLDGINHRADIWINGIQIHGARASMAKSKIGMRTVGTQVLPSGGRAFTVNNRIIRMTGGAWVPDYLLSWSAQRYRDEVRLMAEGNHTIVRVNGCGIMPPEVFFDECDKRGLLV